MSAPDTLASPPRAAASGTQVAHLAIWNRLGREWKAAFWLLVTLRVGLGLFAVAAIRLVPITATGGAWLNHVIGTNQPWSEVVSVWQRYDALWYQQIAENGYAPGNDTIHFEPLFPLLSRIASYPLGGNVPVAALVVSSAAFLVAMWLLYRLVRRDEGPVTAGLTLCLMAFFPSGFFLLAPFTESLFLALTVATFWFARQGRPWEAGMIALAASFARTFGIFLVFPLAYEYVRRRWVGRQWLSVDAVSIALPVAGIIYLFAYWRFVVGETRSPFAVAADWGNRLAPPWTVLTDSWHAIVHNPDPIESFNLACLIGAIVLSVLVARRLNLAYTCYVVPYTLFLLIHEWGLSPLMSDCRYTLVLFPCFIAAARWLARRPWVAAGWLVVSLLFEALFFDYFIHFGFVA